MGVRLASGASDFPPTAFDFITGLGDSFTGVGGTSFNWGLPLLIEFEVIFGFNFSLLWDKSAFKESSADTGSIVWVFSAVLVIPGSSTSLIMLPM